MPFPATIFKCSRSRSSLCKGSDLDCLDWNQSEDKTVSIEYKFNKIWYIFSTFEWHLFTNIVHLKVMYVHDVCRYMYVYPQSGLFIDDVAEYPLLFKNK